MKNKKSILIIGSITFLAITILSLLGITYAYYLATITWSSTTPSITASTPAAGSLAVTFTGSSAITATDIFPGWSKDVTFSVKNTGTLSVKYNLKIVKVTNAVSPTNVVYSIVCTGDGAFSTQTDQSWPVNDTIVKTNITVKSGETHNCKFTAKYKDDKTNQTGEMGKSFSATITIDAAQMTNDNH